MPKGRSSRQVNLTANKKMYFQLMIYEDKKLIIYLKSVNIITLLQTDHNSSCNRVQGTRYKVNIISL